MIDHSRPASLTDAERVIFGKPRIRVWDRAAVAALWEPFRDRYREQVRPLDWREQGLFRAFRFCAGMMLALDCTYWAFTWDRLLAWRAEATARELGRSAIWQRQWDQSWTEVTTTLFFLGVLPYREEIHKLYHRELAAKWLGQERSAEIEERFVAVARTIGYRHERQVRARGVGVLLSVMAASQKRELADLTKADFEAWEAQTGRSPRVASSGVTMAQRVLGAMGHLAGEFPRVLGGPSRARADWGRTTLPIRATFERFLADLGATRRPTTVATYRVVLRRFGDWLGAFDPAVQSVADVRRRHIEAYKQTVAGMRVGEHAPPTHTTQLGSRRGAPLSASSQVRCISCVRAFFDTLEVLEYPERPGRALFVRGDVRRVDEQLPRFIPDDHWHRIVAAAEGLTPREVDARRLPLPFERTRAILAVLLECGLRAGELVRLDTGCLVTARDAAGGGATHWLRVPVGKLHNDRMVPVRPALVGAIDAWMRLRGPQPLHHDERTDGRRDFLFTWQGGRLSEHTLNSLIAALCKIAGVPRYTSHRFRHTLAVQWRRNGMRIETIGQMLGHRSLQMTLRYAAVMPPTMRRELDAAFAALDEEHRTTAQVRVVLSPEAHLAASRHWRESMWVDLGIGWCGLSAFLPCDNRLACLPCPNFTEKREQLPLFEEQRRNLVELSMLGAGVLPADRGAEIVGAITALDRRIVAMSGAPGAEPAPRANDGPDLEGDPDARPDPHARRHNRSGAPRGA
jgi:integrase